MKRAHTLTRPIGNAPTPRDDDVGSGSHDAAHRRTGEVARGASSPAWIERLPGPALDRVCAALGPRDSWALRGTSPALRAQIDAHPKATLGPELAGLLEPDLGSRSLADALVADALPGGYACWLLGIVWGRSTPHAASAERRHAESHLLGQPPAATLRRLLDAAYPCDPETSAMQAWQASWQRVCAAVRRREGHRVAVLDDHAEHYRRFVAAGGTHEDLHVALDAALLRTWRRRAALAALRNREMVSKECSDSDLAAFRRRLGWQPPAEVAVGVASEAPRDILGQPFRASQMLLHSFEQTQPLVFGTRASICFAALAAVATLKGPLQYSRPVRIVVTCPRARVREEPPVAWRVWASIGQGSDAILDPSLAIFWVFGFNFDRYIFAEHRPHMDLFEWQESCTLFEPGVSPQRSGELFLQQLLRAKTVTSARRSAGFIPFASPDGDQLEYPYRLATPSELEAFVLHERDEGADEMGLGSYSDGRLALRAQGAWRAASVENVP